MRAVVHDRYGPPDVLRVEEVAEPEAGPADVIVRVHASTVNRTDCGFRDPRPFFVRAFSGLVRPKHRVLGTEFAGVVDSIGADVTTFAVGDRVFGVNADHFGAHAERLRVAATAPIARMPEGMGFDEAAAVCDGAVLARTCLTAARVTARTKLLIYGATGSIGTAAVQLARHLGADVTAVCRGEHADLVRALGADRVIDRTTEDFTTAGDDFDVVFDAVGKRSFAECRRLLRSGGIYASTDLGRGWQNPPLTLVTRLTSRRVMVPLPKYSQQHVRFFGELLEAGALRPVIDRRYRLDDVVEATRYVETGEKIGNVVLTVTA
jgi:NADPH:quinone reductase-like Zn-dependent oxidoreductase